MKQSNSKPLLSPGLSKQSIRSQQRILRKTSRHRSKPQTRSLLSSSLVSAIRILLCLPLSALQTLAALFSLVFRPKTVCVMTTVCLLGAAYHLLPAILQTNSAALLGLNPPKPLPVLEASSRLAVLSPVSVSEVTHKIRRGDTLSSIAQRYNLPVEDVNAIHDSIESFRRNEKLGHPLKPGNSVSISLNAEGVDRISVPIAIGKTINISKAKNGSFDTALAELPRKKSKRVAMGMIDSSFADAALSSGLSYSMVDELVDLFGDKVAFHKDLRKGDRFSIIYSEEQLLTGQIVGNDEIIGASVEANGQTFYAIRFVGNDGKARFFNTDGEPLGAAILRYPLKFSRISSLFSHARFHPIHKENRPHYGVDFSAPIGTPVRSVAGGRVSFAGRNGGAGIMVKIQHNDRYATAYLHLSKIERGVRNGSFVHRGQVIGAVGSTGNSTGPHLHYSFYDNGVYVDPLKIDLPTIDDLRPGLSPDKGFIYKTRKLLDSYQNESLDRMVSNQKLPKKHLPLVAKSSENA